MLPATQDNPGGNPLLGLMDDQAITPMGHAAVGFDENGVPHLDASAGYYTQNLTTGKLALVYLTRPIRLSSSRPLRWPTS